MPRDPRRRYRGGHRPRWRRQGDAVPALPVQGRPRACLPRGSRAALDAWLVEAEAQRRDERPDEQLLAIFDVFDDWFRGEAFDTCSFINVLLELGPEHPAGRASIDHLSNIRAVVQELANQAGLRDTEAFARSWHILMKGSIIAAAEGDLDAAQRARAMASDLLERHRP